MNKLILAFVGLMAIGCNDSPYMQGKRLYMANCVNCHMEDGSGLANLIPPLSTSGKLGNESMVCIIKNGIRDTIRKDSIFLPREMPAFGKLSATEVANVVNYINHKWDTTFAEKTIIDIEIALKSCP